MSGYDGKHGKREAPGGEFPLITWWNQHRAWVAGLDRGGRIKYRLFQTLVVIAVLIIAVTLFLWSWIRLPDVPDLPGANLSDPGNTSQVRPGQADGDHIFDGAQLPDVAKSGRKDGYYTFLVCGRDVMSGATDTMLLITYDTRGKTVNAVSLLRDTMTNTSGKRGAQKRLNVVFTRNLGDRKLSDKEQVANGMTALKQEVSRLTGVYPDFYVLVEWEAFGRLVEAIGGVYFDVPYDMDYDDPTPGQDLHIHQKKGYRLLNGQDAMEVIRFRKSNKGDPNYISLGDSGRTKIQRDFLTVVLKKCLTPEIILKLPALVQIFTENVYTDLTVGNILAFAQLAIGMDTDGGVTFTSMPYYGVTYTSDSLVCVSEKDMLELLNSGINPYLDEIKSSDLQLMYKKSDGSFGVTNGTLADPAVANPPAVTKPSAPGDGGDDDNNDDPGTTTDPGNTADPGTTTDPGTVIGPPDIAFIDPGVVFPDPSPDMRGEPAANDQAAA